MKKGLILVAIVLVLSVLAGCGNVATDNKDAANLLCEAKTTQFFTDEKVDAEDMNKILSAGVNAPSAMNTQPWHFTAVTDAETNEKLANAMSNMKPPMDKMPPMGDKMPPKGEMQPKDFQGKPEGKPEGKPDMKKGEMPDFAKMPSKAGIGDAPLTIVV